MVGSALFVRRLSARGLFVAQICWGAVAGAVTVVGLAMAGQSQEPAVVLVTLFWLGMTVAVLWLLERRKPLAAAPADARAWSRRVRELRDSRHEIATAYEVERRRIERDLHDGAQQHLVAASLKIGEATLELRDPGTARASDLLAEAHDATETALRELRRTVAGIHPAVLSDLGLEAAVRDLAGRFALDIVVRVPNPLATIPEAVAATAYFLVSEALTNVAKYAPTAYVSVLVASDEYLHVSIVDNGPGGARLETGHGLAGMRERLAAFGGSFAITSPQGGPTTLNAQIPLLLADDQPGITLPTTDHEALS